MLKKFSAPLTAGQLGAALEAAHCLDLYRGGPTIQTLIALFDSLVDAESGESDPARAADGSLPVSAGQIGRALEELREAGLGRAHLASLARARDLVAEAEAERSKAAAAAGGRPATKAELDGVLAAVGVALAAVELAAQNPGRADGSIGWQLAHAETPGMSASTRSALNQLTSAFDRALEGRRIAEAAEPRSRKVWQPGFAPY